MTTIHQVNVLPDQTDTPWREAPFVAFGKGAVDSLVDIATHVWSGDWAIPLTDELCQRISTPNYSLAKLRQRVLGLVFRPLPFLSESVDEGVLERVVTFIGLVVMMDPPRPEVKEAVQTCKTAGIRAVMITGDHPLTATNIARVIKGEFCAELQPLYY